MFEVIKNFRDIQNDMHSYSIGDVYPVEGDKPSKARINELKGKNPYGVAFIKEVEAPKETEKVPAQEEAPEVPEK